MIWPILGIVAGLLLADLLVHIAFSFVVLPVLERKIPFGVKPAEADPDAEQVRIPTTDGLTLAGSVWRPANPRGVVLFCPELGGNHWSAMSYCEALYEAGFAIVSFDFRNQGDSESMKGYDPLHWLTEYEVTDALAAIRYIRSREDLGRLPLGVMGISRGGGAALAAATRSQDIPLVACEGAFSMAGLLTHYTMRWATLYIPEWILKYVPVWHVRLTLYTASVLSQFRRHCRYVRLERVLPRLKTTEVLMIAGSCDSYVPPQVTRLLSERVGSGRTDFWVVRKARHNMARRVEPAAYDQKLVSFFSRMAPQPVGADETREVHA